MAIAEMLYKYLKRKVSSEMTVSFPIDQLFFLHITCAWNSRFTDKYWKFLSVTDLCLFCLGLKEQLVFLKDVGTLTWG